MRILGIDPGTACGWAMRYDSTRVDSGVWDLKPRRHEGAGMRWVRLRRYLREVLEAAKPNMVAYEEVRRHAGTSAAHIYGGIVATIQEECEFRGIPYTAIPVGAVKKTATGRGNAGKDEMIESAREEWPGFDPLTDDEADARWIAETAAREYDEPSAERASA